MLAACRVGGSQQQSVIDASLDSLLPGMAPVGDVDGATGSMNDKLANVTEALCPPKPEGDHPAQGHHADRHCVRHHSCEETHEKVLKLCLHCLKFTVPQGILTASPSSV